MNTSKHELIAPHNPDPIIVTRALVKRAWSDFEPKVIGGLMSGTIAAGIIDVLNAYGVHIPLAVIPIIPVFCQTLAGWWTPSVGTVTTMRTGNGLVVEKHSGSVEIKTGAIPIPGYTQPAQSSYSVPRETSTPVPAPAPYAPPAPPADPEPYEVPDSAPQFTQVIQPTEDTGTPSRANAILTEISNNATRSRAAFYESDNH